jgi:hypothetical protein
MGGGMAGEKLMINTIIGDNYVTADTSSALACSNLASSIAAGSAFLLGPNASLALKSRAAAIGGAASFLAMVLGLPMLLRAKKKRVAEAHN